MELQKCVERIVPKEFKTREEYLLYLRHLFAYEHVLTHLTETDEVLEIGFGEGYGAHLVSDHTKHFTGLDTNREAIFYANHTYGTTSCIFEHYEGGPFPCEADSIDAVICFQVIEHIKEDEKFIKELDRVLKNGGKTFLTTPNREFRLSPGEKPWNEYHIREYSPSGFQSLLEKSFRKVELYGIKGRGEAQAIERNRVDSNLSFYKLLPDSLKGWVCRDFKQKYDTNSFYITQQNLVRSIDLFAKAVK